MGTGTTRTDPGCGRSARRTIRPSAAIRRATDGARPLTRRLSVLEARLRALRERGQAGLVPFVTAGHLGPDTLGPLLATLERAGAAAVEIGIPFSDPLADGPAIQRSSEIALAAGATLERALAEARAFRSGSTLPLVIMSYANPVLAYGVERFAADASAASVSGVILSDVPPEERPDVWAALAAHEIDAILLIAPTTAPARRTALAQRAHGFVYVLARTGVTGAASALGAELEQVIAAVRQATDVPVAVGFGVTDAERARAVARIADAVIVGSALVERLESKRAAGLEPALAEAERWVGELAEAVRSARPSR